MNEYITLSLILFTIGSVGVSTPWRDVYSSSRDSLRRAVHAHLWTGGADSWVWAVPMDGSAPGLGLVLTEGELAEVEDIIVRLESSAQRIGEMLYAAVEAGAPSEGGA